MDDDDASEAERDAGGSTRAIGEGSGEDRDARDDHEVDASMTDTGAGSRDDGAHERVAGGYAASTTGDAWDARDARDAHEVDASVPETRDEADADLALLRAAYVVGGELFAAIRGDGEAHLVHRLRVLLTTLGVHLEGRDGAWLAALRTLDADLHRLALDRLGGHDGADAAAEERLAVEREARARDVLRAADRATFAARVVDLHGASLLTGLGRVDLRRAIDRGELAARDDGRGPLIALDALARFAAARGLEWSDGLADVEAGAAAEATLARLIGGAERTPPKSD